MSETAFFEVRDAGAHVAEIAWSRPPNNFMDPDLVREIADALERLDLDDACRAVVLAPAGKHFCAGANLAGRDRSRDTGAASALYEQGIRLYGTAKPIVAALQGSTVGGGLGIALATDFRVAADDAKLTANFAKLGYYPGFGLTATLPRLLGAQRASHLLLSGRRLAAPEALAIGLVDAVVPAAELRKAAIAFAADLASAAPLSSRAIRQRLRGDLQQQVRAALEIEAKEQARLRATEDFREGVAATAERRPPAFRGR